MVDRLNAILRRLAGQPEQADQSLSLPVMPTMDFDQQGQPATPTFDAQTGSAYVPFGEMTGYSPTTAYARFGDDGGSPGSGPYAMLPALPDMPDTSQFALMQGAQQYRMKRQQRLAMTKAATSDGAQPDDLGDIQIADAPQNVARWYSLAKKYADQYGVPVEDIMAIIENESHGDPNARSAENPGLGRAVGLMQMLPIYHATDGADLTDPETNISRGVRYYAQAYHKRGNQSDKAMAEYFGGGGAFDSAGNIRRDISDVNINIGKYIDTKFLPAKARWAAHIRQPAQGGGAPAATSQSAGALNLATSMIGKPYVWGGTDPNGFDCSGLIQWAYNRNGVTMPRTAQQQWQATQRIQTRQLSPGDLVFYHTTYPSAEQITHVGIYAGNNRVLMAQTEGKPISYVALNDAYWAKHLAGYGRVK